MGDDDSDDDDDAPSAMADPLAGSLLEGIIAPPSNVVKGPGGAPKRPAPQAKGSGSGAVATPPPTPKSKGACSLQESPAELRVGKGRGKSARIPLDMDGILRYYKVDEALASLDAIAKGLQEPPFAHLDHGVQHTSEVETRLARMASELDAIQKDLFAKDTKMAKLTHIRQEALAKLRQKRGLTKTLSQALGEMSKSDFEGAKVGAAVEALSAQGIVFGPALRLCPVDIATKSSSVVLCVSIMVSAFVCVCVCVAMQCANWFYLP